MGSATVNAGTPGPQNLRKRVISGSLWTGMNMGGTMVLRLASNMVLTRLLFPEAFGMMAIVQVFIAALQQFSDTGLRASIIQSKRGDEQAFLDTAWTLQIIRCIGLWLGACALALPVARIYNHEQLATLLPATAFLMVFAGLVPTTVHLADRHLLQRRVVLIQLVAQLPTIAIMVALAYTMRSVWALAIGTVAGEALKTLSYWLFLPGSRNRLRIERSALHEMFHFGKYIFFSTIAGFVLQQGDRAVLGLFIPMGLLGIYNIAFFLANVPLTLSRSLGQKVIFPLQCKKPPSVSAANRAAVFRVQRLMAVGLLGMVIVLAYLGPFLIDLLYDPRYAAAGPMVTLYCLALVPQISLIGFGPAMLSVGDSRRFMISQAISAILQLVLLLVGAHYAKVFGAILAPGLAMLLTTPVRIAFLRHHKAWDPVQGYSLMAIGMAACGLACALHWPEIWALRH